jgi:cbb3-type cytochrome oxidase maturation protein
MWVLMVLIPCSVLLSLGFVVAFVWATKRGQFDDLDTPPKRILFDDQSPKSSPPVD